MDLNNTISRIGVDQNLESGGTYELLLVNTPDGYPTGQISFTFQSTPRKISGIQKVAQFFVRVLFTQKGSDLLKPEFGTEFPNLAIGANQTSNDSSFLRDISGAVQDAANQTSALLGGGADVASQLEKVNILGLDTSQEALRLYVQIVTKAGETASVALPFPELDLKLASG